MNGFHDKRESILLGKLPSGFQTICGCRIEEGQGAYLKLRVLLSFRSEANHKETDMSIRGI